MNKGFILVIFAAILWGTTGTAQSFAPQGVSPSVIGTLRILVGGVVLFIYSLVNKGYKNVRFFNDKYYYLGMSGVALYQLCFFYGVKSAGVAVGTMIGIGSSPIFAGLVLKLFYREKVSGRWVISTIFGLLGLFLITFLKGNDNQTTLFGVFLCLGAGLSYVIYSFASKELMKNYSPDEVMGLIFISGALLLSPFLISDFSGMLNLSGFIVISHLGVMTTAVAYLLFGRGLNIIKINEASTLSLAEPLTATLLGIFLVGESLSFFTVMGMSFIFLSLIIISVSK